VYMYILQDVLSYIAMFGEIIYRQLIFLDGHIELTNKVLSSFSGLRVSLKWKPVHFSLSQRTFWSIVKKLCPVNKMYQ
jgi:hypothetical protein